MLPIIYSEERFIITWKIFFKKDLYYNRAAYGLGLQEPDIFFYYLPSYVLEGHNIGALAHVRETSAFFQGLIESRNQFSSRTDLNIAEAYLIGFLGHYTLDTICHPYIYAMTHYKDKKEKTYFSKTCLSGNRYRYRTARFKDCTASPAISIPRTRSGWHTARNMLL